MDFSYDICLLPLKKQNKNNLTLFYEMIAKIGDMVLVLCTNMANLFWQIFIYSSLPINMYNSESNQQLIINENNC